MAGDAARVRSHVREMRIQNQLLPHCCRHGALVDFRSAFLPAGTIPSLPRALGLAHRTHSNTVATAPP